MGLKDQTCVRHHYIKPNIYLCLTGAFQTYIFLHLRGSRVGTSLVSLPVWSLQSFKRPDPSRCIIIGAPEHGARQVHGKNINIVW